MDNTGSSTLLFFDDWYLHRRENLVRHVGRPLTGDDLFWKPKWKNHPSVSEFMEQVVRLEVKLFNGRIYSIRGNFIPIRSGDYRQFKDRGIPPNPTYEY